MNWFMSMFRGGMLRRGLVQRMQAPRKNRVGRGALFSLSALVGGVVAYGVTRGRNGGGNRQQMMTQALRNRWFNKSF